MRTLFTIWPAYSDFIFYEYFHHFTLVRYQPTNMWSKSKTNFIPIFITKWYIYENQSAVHCCWKNYLWHVWLRRVTGRNSLKTRFAGNWKQNEWRIICVHFNEFLQWSSWEIYYLCVAISKKEKVKVKRVENFSHLTLLNFLPTWNDKENACEMIMRRQQKETWKTQNDFCATKWIYMRSGMETQQKKSRKKTED